MYSFFNCHVVERGKFLQINLEVNFFLYFIPLSLNQFVKMFIFPFLVVLNVCGFGQFVKTLLRSNTKKHAQYFLQLSHLIDYD